MKKLLALVLLCCAAQASAERYYPTDWNDWATCMDFAPEDVDCGPEPAKPPPTPPPAPPPPPPPSPAEQFVKDAGAAYGAKNYDEAIRLSSESIKLDPAKWLAYHYRGWALYAKGRYAQAADDHAKTVELGSGTDGYLSFSVALCKSLAGAHQQSLEWSGRSLGVTPNFPMALTQMGFTYFDLGELAMAKEKFTAALAADVEKKRADTHVGLAIVAHKQGDAAAAQKHLADAKAITADLDAIDIWMSMVRKYTAKQKAAIKALQAPAKAPAKK